MVTARLTQEIDTYNSARPFLPLKLELAMNKGVPIKLDATYNINTGRIETLNSTVGLSVFSTWFSLGQRYNTIEDLMLFTASMDLHPYKRVHITGSIWYDAKGGGLRDMDITMRYQRQCWGLRLVMIKRPGDYSMHLLFDIAGLSGESSKDN